MLRNKFSLASFYVSDSLFLTSIQKNMSVCSIILEFCASTTNNNEKFRSFKSKENIHKKEVGPFATPT